MSKITLNFLAYQPIGKIGRIFGTRIGMPTFQIYGTYRTRWSWCNRNQFKLVEVK